MYNAACTIHVIGIYIFDDHLPPYNAVLTAILVRPSKVLLRNNDTGI